jgi:GT2 family glycosyltransferase
MSNPVLMLCPNGLDLTKRAVASVLEQDVPVDLRVVDQASTDGTAEWLQTQIPDVKIWRFDPQLGVSAGWNFGLVDAFRTADHCLVVNNDVVLRSDNYRLLLEDGNGGCFVTGVSVDNIAAMQGTFTKSIRPHPDFSNFLIYKHVWETVGPFDESMVHYCSDGDYHLRMHQAGIEAYTIGIPFYHYASGTLKTATEIVRLSIEAQADRDRDTFEKKWGYRIGSVDYYYEFSRKPSNG